MNILFAAAECAPLAKVGGLGDVVGSLPKALLSLGADARIILPRYKNIPLDTASQISVMDIRLGQEIFEVKVYQDLLPGSEVKLYLLDEPVLFGSAGVYENSDASPAGQAEAKKFLLYCFCVIKFIKQQIWQPDLLHCHDWHTAVLPLLVKKNELHISTLLTIHNLAMQGQVPVSLLDDLKINIDAPTSDHANLLNLGVAYADAISTVSPTYAQEILTKEFGEGLEFDLQKHSPVHGILNGIDEQIWNETRDPLITNDYSQFSAELKMDDKISLQRSLNLQVDPEIPMIGVVSRLTAQKGFNLLEPIWPKLKNLNFQMVVLGVGEKKIGDFFKDICQKNPGRFAIQEKFDERLAHQIYAASDLFLMPSKFEPCGLGQMIAMHYGSLPIVRATGGLKDSVVDLADDGNNHETATGFVFDGFDSNLLLGQIKRALEIYQNDQVTWHRLVHNAMTADFSWAMSAQKYKELYQQIINQKLWKA